MLRLPLWGWGMAYYVVLAFSVLNKPGLLAWLVPAAAGVEVALVWIALSTKTFCMFCLGNFFVVLLLIIFFFEKRLIWQALAISSLSLLLAIFLVASENGTTVFGAAQQPDSRIVAKVAGTAISERELVLPLASRIYELELQIYRLKQQQLEQLVIERVLEMEAKRRGMTLEQLINDPSLSKGIEVTEEEVDSYYQQNWSRLRDWKGSVEELKERIRASFLQNKSYQKVMEYAKSLYPEYEVSIDLKEPAYPSVKVSVAGNQFLGPPDAAVTVVEFSDYQCPACRRSHEVVKEVREIYKDRVKWVFKDYPLRMHKEAAKAAEAARCAGDQGHFWEYQDLLFASREAFTSERLQEYASRLGLDEDNFQQCVESEKYKAEVEQDLAEGKKVGVDRTPTFVIGGRLITGGHDLDQFKQWIDTELKKAAASS